MIEGALIIICFLLLTIAILLFVFDNRSCECKTQKKTVRPKKPVQPIYRARAPSNPELYDQEKFGKNIPED
jgi:hypothetical protein